MPFFRKGLPVSIIVVAHAACWSGHAASAEYQPMFPTEDSWEQAWIELICVQSVLV